MGSMGSLGSNLQVERRRMSGDSNFLAQINEANDDHATQMIQPFIERSPLLAARVALRRPFCDPEALAAAIAAEIAALSHAELTAFFGGHPELAPIAPAAMTRHSQSEQGRLSLSEPDDALRIRLADLNRRYRQKFGFPFIVALAHHADIDSVLATFARRLEATMDEEMATARDEIVAVSRARVMLAFAGSRPFSRRQSPRPARK